MSTKNEVKAEKLFKSGRLKFSSFSLLVFYYSTIVFSELIIRISSSKHFFGIGLLYIFLFSLPVALILFGLSHLFSNKVNRVVSIVCTALLLVFYDSQLIYYQVFKTFYTVFSLTRAGQATDFVFETVQTILRSIVPFLILFIPLAVIIVLVVKCKDIFNQYSDVPLYSAAACVAIQLIAICCTFLTGRGIFSPYDLYFQTSSLNQSTDRLGLITTFRIDAQRLIFGEPDIIELPLDDSSEDTSSIDDISSTTSTEDTPVVKPIVYTPNILDIDFESLIENCTDSSLKKIHEYFSNAEYTMKNEMTGVYEGYNLIFVTAESFSPYAIDPTLTPTLYKMVNEGITFKNFYNPIWGVSTLDGEYVNLQGLLPKSGVWSMYRSGENYLPFTLGNQFKKLGYNTLAYHNHTYHFYNRDVSHPNLGYTYIARGNGLDVKGTWPESDLEMVEKTTDSFINNGPFHVYYLTVSGHMNYTFIGNSMASKNKAFVKDLPLTEECKAYLACNIEFDRSMELLLERLEAAGIADKTLIVIAPDHYPYGLTKEALDTFAGHTVEENFELYKSQLIVYTKGMTPMTVDKVCSSLDILPTVSNLMGLEYDSRLLMGKDIFSDSEPLVIFANRSWITDKAMYNPETGTVTQLTDEPVDENYINRINKLVKTKFTYSAKVLENDYYSIVFGIDE